MIKNKQELINKGLKEGRELVLDAIEHTLNTCHPRRIIHDSVKLVKGDEGNDILIIKNEHIIKLDFFNSIYVIGGGKASGYMAEALHSILKDRITKGFVIIPDYLEENKELDTGNITLWKATHPIPTKKGVEGVKRMLAMASVANKNDLVICLISGGGSALMPLPYDNITLEEKQALIKEMLKAGANIEEINTVRKHISAIKGGRLAEKLKNTNLLSLIISDVINDRLDTIASGLTAPDNTTFLDAKRVLEKYELWDKASNSIKNVIEEGISGKIKDTPKPNDPIFKNIKNIIIANNEFACLKAKNHFINNGIDASILTTTLQGEAKDVGLVLSSIANEIDLYNRPLAKPVALIAGGETYVTVRGDGRGGRNQEMMLSALRSLTDKSRYIIASLGTDGIDGNSDSAGAIIDFATVKNAKTQGLDIDKFLKNNDSNTFFKKINDAIYTGPTGTNVNDITIILVL